MVSFRRHVRSIMLNVSLVRNNRWPAAALASQADPSGAKRAGPGFTPSQWRVSPGAVLLHLDGKRPGCRIVETLVHSDET